MLRLPVGPTRPAPEPVISHPSARANDRHQGPGNAQRVGMAVERSTVSSAIPARRYAQSLEMGNNVIRLFQKMACRMEYARSHALPCSSLQKPAYAHSLEQPSLCSVSRHTGTQSSPSLRLSRPTPLPQCTPVMCTFSCLHPSQLTPTPEPHRSLRLQHRARCVRACICVCKTHASLHCASPIHPSIILLRHDEPSVLKQYKSARRLSCVCRRKLKSKWYLSSSSSSSAATATATATPNCLRAREGSP